MTGPTQIGSSGDSLREAFGRGLGYMAQMGREFLVLDADVAGGTGTHHIRRDYPDRFIQCGIAEQNMVGVAAGLAAATGLPIFATTFAVFGARAWEIFRLSVAYARRNVTLVLSHTGLDTGEDGASAQSLSHYALWRTLPHVTVVQPCDPTEMVQAVQALLDHDGPAVLLSGRSSVPRIVGTDHRFRLGRASVLREGGDVSLLATGVMVSRALEAAKVLATEGIGCRVVNVSTIKPLDVEMVEACARETAGIVTCEDHSIYGGLGGAVAEAVCNLRPCRVERVGVQDRFGESGAPDDLAEKYGIGVQGIIDGVRRL